MASRAAPVAQQAWYEPDGAWVDPITRSPSLNRSYPSGAVRGS